MVKTENLAGKKSKERKTIAFIDAANIIYGAKKESGFKVDLRKLALYLKSRYSASKIYFYGGVNVKKINFEEYQKLLKNFGFTPRLKATRFFYQKPKTKTFTCRFCQKINIIKERKKVRAKANCDVDLTLDVLENIKSFNRFVFLTGDGDFEPLMIKLKKSNKEIFVIAAKRRTARSIKKIAEGNFVEIKTLEEIIAKQKRR